MLALIIYLYNNYLQTLGYVTLLERLGLFLEALLFFAPTSFEPKFCNIPRWAVVNSLILVGRESHTQARFAILRWAIVNNLILSGRGVTELKELTIVTRFPQCLDVADKIQVMTLIGIATAWITAFTFHFGAVGSDKCNSVSTTKGEQASFQIVAIQQDEFFPTKQDNCRC